MTINCLVSSMMDLGEYRMEGELRSFLLACIVIIACLTYCYFVSSKIAKGRNRLLSILPIIPIFVLLPLLHSSFFLQFYFGPSVGWLANFKLLLFAFGKDDTLSVNPSMSLISFILVTTLPIKLKQRSSTKKERTEAPSFDDSKRDLNLYVTFFVNVFIWSFMMQIYVIYREHKLLKNPVVVHFLYSARMLFGIQVQFALYAALATLLSGQELEPQFNSPHLSSSLQDFWGKRWNLMVSNILKSSVHEPTRSFLTPALGKRWALHPAILNTYVVSGLMHEMMHFYVGRQWPTWEVLWFFIIHGVCLSVEIEGKKFASKKGWKLHPGISIPLTVGFVMVTGIWLCYAELIHYGADVREVEEYAAFIGYLKNIIHRGMFIPASAGSLYSITSE